MKKKEEKGSNKSREAGDYVRGGHVRVADVTW